MNRSPRPSQADVPASSPDGNPIEGSSPSTVASPSTTSDSECARPTRKRISHQALYGRHTRKKPPATGSPALNEFFRLLDASRFYYKDVLSAAMGPRAKRGLNNWKYGVNEPAFGTIEAMAEVIGYRIKWEKIR